jgi:hypothetical protein
MPPSPSTTPCCVLLQSAGAFDGQPGSQLLLVGVQHVHGLYAALQALPWCEPGQPDVPLLSAPVPFLHAQLCPLRLAVSWAGTRGGNTTGEKGGWIARSGGFGAALGTLVGTEGKCGSCGQG